MRMSGRRPLAFVHFTLLFAAMAAIQQRTGHAEFFTVNNSADLGFGSLRQAVLAANLHPGADTILVDPALSGSTIELFAPLPALTEKVAIDSVGTVTIRYVSLNHIFSGGYPIVKENTGTLIFAGNNSYSGGTTVNGGAVQGDSWSLKGDITNHSSVVFNQNSGDGTYSGNITGSGAITKIGGHKLTLAGTNSYAGGTVIHEGLLEGNTSSLQGFIYNNAAVIFDQSFKGTYAGNMIGSGTMTKVGAGTLILSGVNTYSGMTIVSNGVLQGNTYSFSSDIINGATVIFDQPFHGTYAGRINHTGTVIKTGGGILNLTGANTYSGRTFVEQGTLQGNTTSLQGDIVNHAAVTFDQPYDGIYWGVMSGSGSLNKTGAGTLTLAAQNTFTGPTTVFDGRLQVLGRLSGPVNVVGGTFAPTAGTAWVTPSLQLGGTPTSPSGSVDVGGGAVVVDYAPGSGDIAATVRQQVIAARGGTDIVGAWSGRGITSNLAAAANNADPGSRSVAYAENGKLPLGPYSIYRGAQVDDTSVLITFTRTGDANLDGVVNDADMTIVGATYAPGLPQPAWALGDFDYNGFVDDNDVTLLSAFYDPLAVPFAQAQSEAAATGTVATVPEPAGWALLIAVGIPLLVYHVRRSWCLKWSR